MRRPVLLVAVALLAASPAVAAPAAFDLVYQIENAGGGFTPLEVQILSQAMTHAENAWETVITGYASTAPVPSLLVHIWPTTVGLAAASHNGLTTQGLFTYSTGGDLYVNVDWIEDFANWQGAGANGLNFVDELLVHETGHVLGIGTLWALNGAYVPGTFHYTGPHGLAAYRAEFNATAAGVPVESAGESGTAGAHWDQRMRSSSEEGNPDNPWSLEPRLGVVDAFGHDAGLEVMTGAIDPDYGEPFFSRTTVESMRDMGYATTRFEDANGDGSVSGADLAVWKANFGTVGLQIDSFAYGDADRDRAVAGRDFLLWQRALGSGGAAITIPEPTSLISTAIACVLGFQAATSCRRTGMHQTV